MIQPQAPGLDLHHMSAIVSDAQTNLDFYTQVLGLRLVRLTVNYDDPSAYHLYFGDRLGTPGTGLTFFPYPGRKAKVGPGQVKTTKLAVGEGSLGFWVERLAKFGVPSAPGLELGFVDPDGLEYEIVPSALPPHGEPWGAVVPEAHAIHGMAGVRIQDGSGGETAQTLHALLGYQGDGERMQTPSGRTTVDLLPSDPEMRGHGGTGSVHHIAFRLPNDDAQLQYHDRLYEEGFKVSPIMDRDVFHSIYFREPGGVLFELATDSPGFGTDVASLGTSLQLPAQYESARASIEASLPKLRLPGEPVEVKL